MTLENRGERLLPDRQQRPAGRWSRYTGLHLLAPAGINVRPGDSESLSPVIQRGHQRPGRPTALAAVGATRRRPNRMHAGRQQ